MSLTRHGPFAGQAPTSRLSRQYVATRGSESVVPLNEALGVFFVRAHVYNPDSPTRHTAGTASRIGVTFPHRR